MKTPNLCDVCEAELDRDHDVTVDIVFSGVWTDDGRIHPVSHRLPDEPDLSQPATWGTTATITLELCDPCKTRLYERLSEPKGLVD